jgi:hypothetical protein
MRTISSYNNFISSGTSVTFTIGVGGNVSRVYGVELIYDAGAPGTTVFTISNLGRTLLTAPAGNSNKYFPILEQAFGSNGTVLTTGNPYVEYVVSGTITVAVTAAAVTTGLGYGCALYLYDD